MTNESLSIWDFIDGFSENVSMGFEARWGQIKPDLFKKHIHEVVGGLLARQATLTIELARAPMSWNPNVAPLILRAMVDVLITFAWILEDTEDRTKKYLDYGLGQEKLFIEFLEEELRDNPEPDEVERLTEFLEYKRMWLNSQLAEWATIVNVGSWSGISTRDMAKEIDRDSLYKFAYVPYSGAAHSMWQHISVHNIAPCRNPLHNGHLVPKIIEYPISPFFIYSAAKYLSQAYEIFDEKFEIHLDEGIKLPLDYFFDCPLFSDMPEESLV